MCIRDRPTRAGLASAATARWQHSAGLPKGGATTVSNLAQRTAPANAALRPNRALLVRNSPFLGHCPVGATHLRCGNGAARCGNRVRGLWGDVAASVSYTHLRA